MGKLSKRRKRSLGRAKFALLQVIGLSEKYYNDPKMMEICKIAKAEFNKKK